MSQLSPIVAEDPQVEINRAWVTFTRNVFALLSRHGGPDITYRMKSDPTVPAMSEAERTEAEARDFEAAALRRGYAEALLPVQRRFMAGTMNDKSAEAWRVIFFIQNAQFRPKPAELDKAVRKELKLPTEDVAGHVADARQVVAAPVVALPPKDTKPQRPSWLGEFAEVVGNNELLAAATIRPLLNMSDPAALDAIASMRLGKERKKHGDDETLKGQRASTERRRERSDFVGGLLSEVKRMNQADNPYGDGSEMVADWGMPGFILMGKFDEGDTEALGYAPGRVFTPTGVPGRVMGWVPEAEYRQYLEGQGKTGKRLLDALDGAQGIDLRPMTPSEKEVAG